MPVYAYLSLQSHSMLFPPIYYILSFHIPAFHATNCPVGCSSHFPHHLAGPCLLPCCQLLYYPSLFFTLAALLPLEHMKLLYTQSGSWSIRAGLLKTSSGIPDSQAEFFYIISYLILLTGDVKD